MTLDIGLVGAGGRAGAHCRSLAAMDDARLAAVCDVEPDRAAATAEEYGVGETFVEHGAMLDAVDLDAAVVATMPYHMDPIVTDCLERGLHVLVEKPPGVTADQTRRWAELAAANGCRTAVGFQRRFNPLSVAAKAAIEERSDVRYGVGTFHKHQLGSVERGGGVYNALLLDIVHVVDLLVWMGGGVEAVHGVYGQLFEPPERFNPTHANVYAGVLEFANGGIGLLNANRTAGGRDLAFEMHGKGVSAYGDIHGGLDTDELVLQRDGEAWADAERVDLADVLNAREPPTRLDGTFQLVRHFVERARADEPTRVSFADAVETMETVEELLQGRRFPPAPDA